MILLISPGLGQSQGFQAKLEPAHHYSHMAIYSADSSMYTFAETRASSRLSRNYNRIHKSAHNSQLAQSLPFFNYQQNQVQKSLPTPCQQPQQKPKIWLLKQPFHGNKEDESPEDFLCAFYRRMGDKTDDSRKNQFCYYLQANGAADEWFSDLSDKEKKSWKDIEAAFEKRWPKKKQIKKTEDEYEDEIVGRKLKAEDLGKKEVVAGRETYTHLALANKMATSVKSAKWEKTTNQLWQVRKSLPNILREKVGTRHADWEAFLEDVHDVDIKYIWDSIDIRNKEQAAINQRIKVLELLSRSPTAPLCQQLSTITITSQPSTPSQQVIGDPFINASGGRGNLAFTTSPAPPCQPRPPFMASNPRPAPTQEQKTEICLLLNKLPHHPNTQAAHQAHQAHQTKWVRTFGYSTKVTEKTPYPLQPGMAPVNSGKCFTCGHVGHLGAQTGEACKVLGHQPLHPNKQQWRVICVHILRDPKVATNVHFMVVDDYGTTLQEIQGNGEGPLT